MGANNVAKDKNALVSLPLPVPNGTLAGAVIALGTAGLRALAITDQAVAFDPTNPALASFNAAGVPVGSATVTLIGVSLVVRLAIGTAINQFAAVYIKTDGTYTSAANNGSGTNYTFIGYFIDPNLAAAGVGRVALSLS